MSSLGFNGEWLTSYFRRRWVLERSEDVIQDLCACVIGLDREIAISILSGNKKIETRVDGCWITRDYAKEIDGQVLVGE